MDQSKNFNGFLNINRRTFMILLINLIINIIHILFKFLSFNFMNNYYDKTLIMKIEY